MSSNRAQVTVVKSSDLLMTFHSNSAIVHSKLFIAVIYVSEVIA